MEGEEKSENWRKGDNTWFGQRVESKSRLR